MALQSEAMVVSEKIPVQWYSSLQLPPPLHHQVDEREGFLLWLRGEFAAANAIIDALCHHLGAVGDPGEYDGVIGCIQQRRCNWSPILHMQQYFPVAEVVYALQHAGWRRQSAGLEGSGRVGGGGRDFRRRGRFQRGGFEAHNSGWEVSGKDLNNGYVNENSNASEKQEGGDILKKAEEEEENKDGSTILEISPQTFIANEICEGKLVNIAEGMKLYDKFFEESEISKLSTLVNDLRASGKRGQLQGQTFTTLRRPMRGHGREIIQLGVPIVDANPGNEETAATSRDIKIEPIPELLQDIIQRLLTEEVVSMKPDSAKVDLFNEGDYSQPYMWPQPFGRPVCLLFLTECEMSFSKVITADHPGDFRGALKLSLSPGSMLVMQGKSSDFARHAICSQRKQRILITFAKSQPKILNADAQYFPSPPSNWAPPSSRLPQLPSHNCPRPTEHFGSVPSTLPTANNGIQPMFVQSWPVGPPPSPLSHARLPVPGTGVFIPPPGLGNTSTVNTAGSEESGGKKSMDDQLVREKDMWDGKKGEDHDNNEALEGGGV